MKITYVLYYMSLDLSVYLVVYSVYLYLFSVVWWVINAS